MNNEEDSDAMDELLDNIRFLKEMYFEKDFSLENLTQLEKIKIEEIKNRTLLLKEVFLAEVSEDENEERAFDFGFQEIETWFKVLDISQSKFSANLSVTNLFQGLTLVEYYEILTNLSNSPSEARSVLFELIQNKVESFKTEIKETRYTSLETSFFEILFNSLEGIMEDFFLEDD